MESQHPHPRRHRPPHPHLHHILPSPSSHLQQRTINNTPVSSPGLFSPSLPRSFPLSQPGSEFATPASLNSPYLHPLQGHKVRETHKANVEHDCTTGRKHINNYEIIEELGRGVHGKVKLARNSENGEFVAIKIIPRFSKKRRLGKVTAMSTQDKSKREIAILKKIRHPNVVALLEIIDDPELKKIYMVLEHVELGEVVWRKKGLPHICEYERRRVEREMRGEQPTPQEQQFERLLEQRQALRDAERAKKRAQLQVASADYWSLEYGPADDEDLESHRGSIGSNPGTSVEPTLPRRDSATGSQSASQTPSRSQSNKSLSNVREQPPPTESNAAWDAHHDDLETSSVLATQATSTATMDAVMSGLNMDDPALRGRSPSVTDSIMSHMSALDYNRVRDPYVDDFSYVPCFTIEQARQTFRDTVLGLEYLHYEGVVHRDIKPANLLWTRDKRTKIADFGVSYFGRPVRDGEPDDTISESEARDFDNDFELAKTVGTPAFFAPELCATDLHDSPSAGPPKVSEQIDVWSLGVTLYCLIFARIPFLAEDEWQMFKKIANDEVYIPKRRLRPVDPATKPNEKSLYTRVNKPPYRDDDELAYEDIGWELQDLLHKMLTKNPDKRIRLRDVKRHPWVLQGLDATEEWLENTDPSRRTSGQKIQVDDKEVAHAVVPLTLFERARSAVKKAVGKVIHPRGDRTESVTSRRRATSSAASSAGESPVSGLAAPHLRDARRRSLRPDDYFSSASQPSAGHPLTHSVVASPSDEAPAGSGSPTAQHQSSTGGHALRPPLELLTSLGMRNDHWARNTSGSPNRAPPRHGHARSLTHAFLGLNPAAVETQTLPPTPLFDSPVEDPSSTLRKARDTRPPADESGRARSVDRGLFASNDKRAEARVSLSTAVAPGNVQFTPGPRPVRSIELIKELDKASSSGSPSASSSLSGYQHAHFKSDPNIRNRRGASREPEERPSTAHRVVDFGDARTPPQSRRRQASPPEVSPHHRPLDGTGKLEPAHVPRPPSPDDDSFGRIPPSRSETVATGKSSSSVSMGTSATPLTSPSESTSPAHGSNTQMAKEAADQMMAFQSDPSLPALLSSTSSVSADPEGEFLGHPGFVGRSSVIDTTDSLTPPAFAKEPISGFPLDAQEDVPDGAVAVKLDDGNAAAAHASAGRATAPSAAASPARAAAHSHSSSPSPAAAAGRRFSLSHVVMEGRRHHAHDDENSDSDSDEGLVMARPRKKSSVATTPAAAAAAAAAVAQTMGTGAGAGRLMVIGGGPGEPRRRDTSASVGSTETAKKIAVVDSD
ncbi:hypothetical protein VTK26DRAFT_8509 [Humicola hyalothermophila]